MKPSTNTLLDDLQALQRKQQELSEDIKQILEKETEAYEETDEIRATGLRAAFGLLENQAEETERLIDELEQMSKAQADNITKDLEAIKEGARDDQQ